MPFTGTNLILNNRCSIVGFTSTLNDYNEQVKTPLLIASNVPCRLMNAKGKSLVRDNQAIVADYVLYLPFGQDVRESYTVTIQNQSYEILFVDPNPSNSKHHSEAFLRVVRSQ